MLSIHEPHEDKEKLVISSSSSSVPIVLERYLWLPLLLEVALPWKVLCACALAARASRTELPLGLSSLSSIEAIDWDFNSLKIASFDVVQDGSVSIIRTTCQAS